MSKNQAKHHAPDEPKSRALALKEQGYSQRHIAELVSTPRSTVALWIREAEAVQGNKPILDKWTRRSLQALDLIGDGLDAIEEDGDAKKHMQTLNMIAGTGTDKLQKESAPPQHNTQVIIVLDAKKPEIIEGEIVE